MEEVMRVGGQGGEVSTAEEEVWVGRCCVLSSDGGWCRECRRKGVVYVVLG